jgi:hypothetical protein
VILLVTYTLRNQFKDYSSFYEAIQQSSTEWWHFIDDSWIINTTKTPTQVAAKLYPHMEESDALIVVRLHKNYDGWLPQEAWEWLNKKFF